MRRKKYIENKKSNHQRKGFNLFLIFTLIFSVLISIILFFAFKLSNIDKYLFVNRDLKDGSTNIYVVDSKNDYIKKYTFSDEMIIDSSYGYGEYNLKNLWVLSEKEKIGGKLVVTSINKNFNLPLFYYLNGNQTNMDLLHRIKSKMVISNLVSDDYLIKDFELPKYISVDFVNNEIQESGVEVIVEDLTGSYDVGENIAQIIDTIGSKVVDYKKGYDENLDCEVIGQSQYLLADSLSSIFNCKFIESVDYGERILIRIGAKFGSRF